MILNITIDGNKIAVKVDTIELNQILSANTVIVNGKYECSPVLGDGFGNYQGGKIQMLKLYNQMKKGVSKGARTFETDDDKYKWSISMEHDHALGHKPKKLTMETLVIEYSQEQGQFHIDSLEKAIETNLQAIKEGRVTSFVIVGLADDYESAQNQITQFEASGAFEIDH